MPEVDAGTGFGAFAPMGTPPDRIAALGKLIKELNIKLD